MTEIDYNFYAELTKLSHNELHIKLSRKLIIELDNELINEINIELSSDLSGELIKHTKNERNN